MYFRLCWKNSMTVHRSLTTTGFSTDSKPFDSIPGPKSLPIFGTLYKYLPVIGENF